MLRQLPAVINITTTAVTTRQATAVKNHPQSNWHVTHHVNWYPYSVFIPGPAKLHWNAEWIVAFKLVWTVITAEACITARVQNCQHTAKTHHAHNTCIHSTSTQQYTHSEYICSKYTHSTIHVQMFVNDHQVGLTMITVFIFHNQMQKNVPNCDVHGEHVTKIRSEVVGRF